MKIVKQIGIILAISFAGELLSRFIPLPVPSSIYGLAILFVCLLTGVLKTEDVSDTAGFLVKIMPLLFLPSLAGLIDMWDVIRPVLLPVLIIIVLSTCAVFFASGKLCQKLMRKNRKDGEDNA